MGGALLDVEGSRLEEYFSLAEDASGEPVGKIALEGPLESLTRTEVAQPALFCVSLAATDAARGRRIEAAFVAGHSLGEYTAACAAGAVPVEEAIELVCLRGRLMADVGDEHPGAMAAVLGLSADEVERLCEEASKAGKVTLANVNSPTQLVVSGPEGAVARLAQLAEEAGARRVVRLQVAAAFHSELMKPVQERMEVAVGRASWRDPQVPVAVNARGELVRDAASLRAALVEQIAAPVLWVACVEALARAGAESFLELGPGRVLSGLVRDILESRDVSSADSPATLDAFVERSLSRVGATDQRTGRE
jgi:[acyl-carrier-protein] S-malonyltransferase